MKKQTKKLSLNKKTISNLTAAEMSRQVGGSYYSDRNTGCCYTRKCHSAYCTYPTQKGHTCNGHCQ